MKGTQMSLKRFDATFPEQGPIYINPDHVVAVQAHKSGNSTKIYTSLPNKDGSPYCITVTDSFERVIGRFAGEAI